MSAPRFESLFDEHYGRVARMVYLITGDRQEALDVAQETFARAYERWKQVSAMTSPEGWIYRVATNLAISSRRRGTRRVRRTIGEAQTIEAEPSDPQLKIALDSLSPAQRAAVVCRFYLDMSVDDTARTLDKKPGTVRALTSQATSRLRESLGPEFLEVRDERSLP